MFLKELTSFIAALLFAVHPIHTEAVSVWYYHVVSRKKIIEKLLEP